MILQFSIPSIIAMVLTSLITIADGYFTGNYVGKEGIAAINLGLPIVYLYLGLGLMVSIGGSVIAGMALGAGNKEKCNAVFSQTMLTTVVISCLVSVVVFVLFQPLMDIFRAKGEVATYFRQYYSIILIEMPLTVIMNSFGMFIRGEGNPEYFMKISVGNVIGNVVLDYVFSSWLHLGIRGIALGSLISVSICILCILQYFLRRSKVYKFRKFTFSKEVFISTLLNGSSEFIGEMSMCITMFAYNYVIMKDIGVDGVTAFTIVGYVSYMFSMILIGFGQGSSPLISFVYGAKEKELAKEIRKQTNKFVFGAGIVVIILMLLTSGVYSRVFVKNEEIQEMVQSGIWIFILSFLFSGINTITSFYFTSIGKAKESAIISSLRGLILLLICILILPSLFGMTGVWLVAPVTEFLTVICSLGFLHRETSVTAIME